MLHVCICYCYGSVSVFYVTFRCNVLLLTYVAVILPGVRYFIVQVLVGVACSASFIDASSVIVNNCARHLRFQLILASFGLS